MEDKERMQRKKKWTLMFFFASDNNLTSSMLHQLKSIKSAGYQLDTNVLVHFDPHERGIPSMIFEVNKAEKEGQTASKIGDDANPTIHDLFGDQIEPEIHDRQYKRRYSTAYDEQTADEALTHFLEVCHEDYPAEQYMLFLVGHGLVVGGDAFLPDENPQSGISLVDLGRILRNFHGEIDKHGETLELIGMHSCSMSAVEVAYQLKGLANYMMGSEGLSFVGAWPYRQMLQKIFYTIDQRKRGKIDVPELMKDLHELCLHNSADFIFAGYSSDLCLISLDRKRVEALTGPIEQLTRALTAGLNDDRCKDLILLAHWKSQSYYQELYTDLYDFCLCLQDSCSSSNRVQEGMRLACKSVIEVLTPEKTGEKPAGPIVQADFCGADCQYSHGLSIYFPWARPYEDAREHVIRNYRNYAFVTSLCGASWLQFLEAYFEKTMRPKQEIPANSQSSFDVPEVLRFPPSGFIPIPVQSSFQEALTRGKVSPADASGYYSYTFIKNYSRELSMTARAMPLRRTAVVPGFGFR